MKATLFRCWRRKPRGGFSLVEATLSLGILSVGFLTLAPLLVLGMKTVRLAQDNRDTAQIAQTMIEEARQGTLSAGTAYLDFQGNPVGSSQQAAYAAQSTYQSVSGSTTLTRLTLQITPVGAPDRARTYAVVVSAPQ